jgi:hypothetical protein
MYAIATIAFVGMQPVIMQVPPNRWRSTTATDIPEARFFLLLEKAVDVLPKPLHPLFSGRPDTEIDQGRPRPPWQRV